jgi:hypothetical protein
MLPELDGTIEKGNAVYFSKKLYFLPQEMYSILYLSLDGMRGRSGHISEGDTRPNYMLRQCVWDLF